MESVGYIHDNLIADFDRAAVCPDVEHSTLVLDATIDFVGIESDRAEIPDHFCGWRCNFEVEAAKPSNQCLAIQSAQQDSTVIIRQGKEQVAIGEAEVGNGRLGNAQSW